MGDNMSMNMDTGELHLASSWKNDDDDDDIKAQAASKIDIGI